MDGDLSLSPTRPGRYVFYGDRGYRIGRVVYLTLVGAGILLFVGGFYLLPIGTDIYLYFFVERVAGGDWFLGSVLANITAVCLILAGLLLLRSVGKRPSLSNSGGDVA